MELFRLSLQCTTWLMHLSTVHGAVSGDGKVTGMLYVADFESRWVFRRCDDLLFEVPFLTGTAGPYAEVDVVVADI